MLIREPNGGGGQQMSFWNNGNGGGGEDDDLVAIAAARHGVFSSPQGIHSPTLHTSSSASFDHVDVAPPPAGSTVEEAAPGPFSSPPQGIHNHNPTPHLPSYSFGEPEFASQSRNETRVKRIKFSHPSFVEEEEIGTSEESSCLGLTLNKSPSFIDLVERKLSEGRRPLNPSSPIMLANVDCDCNHNNINNNNNKKPISKPPEDYGSQPMSEKLKASNFPAMFLRIGKWERVSKHEGDLVAKCYYAKKKLVWEVLEGALKSKIEIQWNDIAGIRAIIAEDQPGVLEIELNQPPSFFRETNPQPRKHTLWQQANDFTGGQALKYRLHYVRFAPGFLDKHYEKLLQCYPRLAALSQRPFPSMPSPFFETNMRNSSPYDQLSPDFLLEGYGSSTPYLPKLHHQHPIPCWTPSSNSQFSVAAAAENGTAYWRGGATNHLQTIQSAAAPILFQSAQQDFPTLATTRAAPPFDGMGMPNVNDVGPLNYIENHLLTDGQIFVHENGVTQHMDMDINQLQMASCQIGGEEQQLIQNVNDPTSPPLHRGFVPLDWEFEQQASIYNHPTNMSSPQHQYHYPFSAYNNNNNNNNHNL